MQQKKIESGKDFLNINKLDGKDAVSETNQAKQPPPIEELAEVNTPDLSTDTFRIADKEFKIKISNIKTQKIMAKSMSSINDLLSKIDIQPIAENFRNKMSKNITEEDVYVDIAEILKTIILAGGLDNILISIMDLITRTVFAICNGQDNTVTVDWVEENVSFNQAQDIFFRQMKKDEIQGRVIDFLALAIRLLTKKTGSI